MFCRLRIKKPDRYWLWRRNRWWWWSTIQLISGSDGFGWLQIWNRVVRASTIAQQQAATQSVHHGYGHRDGHDNGSQQQLLRHDARTSQKTAGRVRCKRAPVASSYNRQTRQAGTNHCIITETTPGSRRKIGRSNVCRVQVRSNGRSLRRMPILKRVSSGIASDRIHSSRCRRLNNFFVENIDYIFK